MKLVTRTYVAVVASLLLFLIATVVLIGIIGNHAYQNRADNVVKQFKQEVLTELDLTAIQQNHQQKRLARHLIHEFSREYRVRIMIFDAEHRPILRPNRPNFREFAEHPRFQKMMQQHEQRRAEIRKRREQSLMGANGFFARKRVVSLVLADGFSADIHVEAPVLDSQNFGIRLLIGLAVLFLCSGFIAYPLTKRLTKRLHQLSDSVATWGKQASLGDTTALSLDNNILSGKDEVAELGKRFEEASKRITSLIDANRLLLANASHEIRTPLTRIRLNVEMLENLINEEHQENFQKRENAIKRNLNELDTLVESILQSSRLDAQTGLLHAQMVNLTQLIKTESEHYADVTLTLAEDVMIHGQQDLLIQLIRNLLNNALKHGQPRVFVVLSQQQNRIVLSVTDSGNGIPDNKLNEIFKPFVRLSNNNKGNGLGLSLVKKIVDLHKAKISVKNVNKGACFTIIFPLDRLD